MNIQSGVFTTAQQGIYQISFTAKYVASRQGTYGAWSDIYVNNKVQKICSYNKWTNLVYVC